MTKRRRFGVVRRATPARRTFRGILFDSLLEATRAMQLAAMESEGQTWQPHPKFILGCPENVYTADFRVWPHAGCCIEWRSLVNGKLVSTRVHAPNGYVEEVKSAVQIGVRRLMKLWKAHGQVPLLILTAAGGEGIRQQWSRRVIVPLDKTSQHVHNTGRVELEPPTRP